MASTRPPAALNSPSFALASGSIHFADGRTNVEYDISPTLSRPFSTLAATSASSSTNSYSQFILSRASAAALCRAPATSASDPPAQKPRLSKCTATSTTGRPFERIDAVLAMYSKNGFSMSHHGATGPEWGSKRSIHCPASETQ